MMENKILGLICNVVIMFTIMLCNVDMCKNTYSVGEQQESDNETLIQEASTEDVQIQLNSYNTTFDQHWNESDKYLIAKLVKCEAGNKTIGTKCKIIQTIYNRIRSNEFPGTVSDVICQHDNGVYQFSPVAPDGSWWYNEPDDSCYEAVELFIENGYDPNDQVLYFESLPTLDDNWHWDNLTFLYQLENMRFYK